MDANTAKRRYEMYWTLCGLLAAGSLLLAPLLFLWDLAADGSPSGMGNGAAVERAHLANQAIDESSGLAVSHRHEGVFYTHNDSGDAPRFFAFDAAGRHRGEFRVPGAAALDWEDMASFVRNETAYLLLADVGDNRRARPHVTLYVVEEPHLSAAEARLVETIHFRFEDGPHDCEAVAVDAAADEVLLVTKQAGLQGRVYRLPLAPAADGEPAVARAIATLHLPPVTAMDLAPDGRRCVVLTYGSAYEYVRRDGEDWTAAFARPGRRIPMPLRKQGEAICYGIDGKTLYLTSEKRPTPFWAVPVGGN